MLRHFLLFLSLLVAEINCQSTTTSVPTWPTLSFKSLPTASPLVLNTTRSGSTKPGYIFYAQEGSSFPNSRQSIIASQDGFPVWIGPQGVYGHNFGPQVYNNKTVLVYWNGTLFGTPIGRGYGDITLLDHSYEAIATVSLPGAWMSVNISETHEFPSGIDIHESTITPRGTILVIANNVTQADLTSVGGPPDGWVVESQAYEIDIATNDVVWSWRSLDHLDQIPFTLSVYSLGSQGFTGTSPDTAWSYFHINAVNLLNDGYFIGSRFTCSGYALTSAGDVIWRLSGTDGGDFQPLNNASFCFQYDLRPVPALSSGDELVLAMHDDHNDALTLVTDPTTSTGLVLSLDLKAMTATTLKRYEDPKNLLFATGQGACRVQPDGGVFIGHGFTPIFQEFGSNGEILYTAQFGPVIEGLGTPQGGVMTYRVFKDDWVGCPTSNPDIAVERIKGIVKVWMSWNGATEFQKWIVYGGKTKDPSDLSVLGTVEKNGFETEFSTSKSNVNFVQVEAICTSNVCGYASKQSSVISV